MRTWKEYIMKHKNGIIYSVTLMANDLFKIEDHLPPNWTKEDVTLTTKEITEGKK